jgi:hypothetical protein
VQIFALDFAPEVGHFVLPRKTAKTSREMQLLLPFAPKQLTKVKAPVERGGHDGVNYPLLLTRVEGW